MKCSIRRVFITKFFYYKILNSIITANCIIFTLFLGDAMKRIAFFIMISICLLFDGIAVSGPIPILIIESYHSEYSWDKSYIQGIKEEMQGDYEFHTFQMDTKRIPKSDYEKSAQNAWDFYIQKNPDLVFLGDDNALKYLGPKFAKVKTPVVFLGINNNPRAYNVINAANITGILERPLLKRSIIEMRNTIKLEKILVLFDSGTTSRVTFDETFRGKERLKLGSIDLHMKLVGSWKTWQENVKTAKAMGFDALYVGLYHTIVDETNSHIDAEKVLSWTSENTPIPPFAFWDFAVGPGKAIGGLTLFGKTQGQAAAKVAMKILAGTSPKDILVRYGKKGQFLFSRSELKKHKIKLSNEIAEKAIFID